MVRPFVPPPSHPTPRLPCPPAALSLCALGRTSWVLTVTCRALNVAEARPLWAGDAGVGVRELSLWGLCVGRPHAYAPVLPTQCMHFVHSPMPFLFGVHVMPKDLPKGVVIVNLENNEVNPACNVHVS